MKARTSYSEVYKYTDTNIRSHLNVLYLDNNMTAGFRTVFFQKIFTKVKFLFLQLSPQIIGATSRVECYDSSRI